MASLHFNLPESVSWGDYLLDGRKVTLTVEVKKASTEPVHIKKEDTEARTIRMPWCKRGNSCPWSNCKFRHVRCMHFDRWKASDCEGRGCRSLKYDPLSNKCPADGGCQYDHRGREDMREFIEKVEILNEEDLMKHFGGIGLEYISNETYDTSDMKKEDKQMMIRSLKAARELEVLMYGEDDDDFIIHFID